MNRSSHKFLRTRNRPPRKNPLAFSYTETLFAALIISVLLVTALKLFGNIARSTRDATTADIAEQIALDMIREIKSLPYEDPSILNDATIGLESGESSASRAAFDDIDDYDNWSAPPQKKNGALLSQYSGFICAVSVQFVSAADFSQVLAVNEKFKRVIIAVSRNNQMITRHTYILPNLTTP